jgi:glutaredoxin/glutathione-dependent peroxiredoxin
MTIKAGEKMPEGSFTQMTKDGPQKLTSEQLFAGKTVVLFSVPGAFTPTCDAKHLPGFVEMADQIRAKGVDTIACTAVNDVFVMNAWGKHGGVGDKILMLADGNGAYVKSLGLEMDGSKFGMGTRGQRFAIIVKDGVASQVDVEKPGEFKVSAAEHVLTQL